MSLLPQLNVSTHSSHTRALVVIRLSGRVRQRIEGEGGIHERFIIGATKAFPGYKLDDLFYVSRD